MVDVGVREQDEIHLLGVETQIAVHTVGLQALALVHTAVEQYFGAFLGGEQEFAAGHLFRGA